jgi:hypothetical protein
MPGTQPQARCASEDSAVVSARRSGRQPRRRKGPVQTGQHRVGDRPEWRICPGAAHCACPLHRGSPARTRDAVPSAPARLRCGAATYGRQQEAVTIHGRRRVTAVRMLQSGPGRNYISAGRNHSFRRPGTRISYSADDSAAAHLRNADRTGLVVLAWTGDRSPVWGCTTTSGDQVPPRTHITSP